MDQDQVGPGRNISYILRNPQNHCLEMKCFAHNLSELDSYVTQSSGDKNVGWGNKATLKRNIQDKIWPRP